MTAVASGGASLRARGVAANLSANQMRGEGLRERVVSRMDTVMRPCCRWDEMVAREGSAPSISGCRPDVILFHQRAGK